jgi:hypothetical protein
MVVNRPLGPNSSFSLHAGATAGSGANLVESYDHYPLQIPLFSDFVPTTIRTPVVGDFSSKRAVPVQAQPNFPWISAPIITNIGPLFSAITNPVTSGRTSAIAAAFVKFSGAINAKGQQFYIADSSGTSALVDRRDRPGQAGALVLDPLDFLGAKAGDVADSFLTFNKDSFKFQVDDPNGFAGSVLEGGANLAGITTDPNLGTSYAGNPLVYRLTIAFDGVENSPTIHFQSNRTGGGNFYDPGTDIVLDDYTIESRLQSMIQQVGPHQWGLANSFDLFEYRATLTQDMALAQLDDIDGVVAIAGSVPEPASLVSLMIGGMCGGLWRLRRK